MNYLICGAAVPALRMRASRKIEVNIHILPRANPVFCILLPRRGYLTAPYFFTFLRIFHGFKYISRHQLLLLCIQRCNYINNIRFVLQDVKYKVINICRSHLQIFGISFALYLFNHYSTHVLVNLIYNMQEADFTSFLSTKIKVVSLDTEIKTVTLWSPASITTQLKNGNILLGKPLLKKLRGGEAPK